MAEQKSLSIEDKIFMKQCLDEYNYLKFHQPIAGGYVRRVPGAATKGTGLKELSVIIRSDMMNTSSDIIKLVNAYKAKMLPKGSIKDVMTELDKADSAQYENGNCPVATQTPFSQAVVGINNALKTINFQIEFIRTLYKVADSNDERWNKATVSSILHAEMLTDDFGSSGCWDEIDKIEAETKAAKINTNSPEYGKLIIKRLNAFKADMISAFNKYYGKNSVFAELNLSDMVRC